MTQGVLASQPSRPPGSDWLWAFECLRGAYSDETIRSYIHALQAFERFCEARGATVLPPDPATVVAFVDDCFATRAPRTADGRVTAISRLCQVHGLADVTRTLDVRLALQRGRRVHGRRSKQAPPINALLRDRLRAACPGTLRGLRDKAFLSLGYDTLCRRLELQRINVEEIMALPDGTARVRIRREKQDPAGNGAVGYLSAQGLADVTAWLKAAGLTRGPVLRTVHNGRVKPGPWNRDRMGPRLREIALAAGLEPKLARSLTCHSLRVGAVHDLVAGGASLMEIMRAGRWRSIDMVAHYAREAPVNPWGQTDGDGFPLAAKLHLWRNHGRAGERRLANLTSRRRTRADEAQR